MTQLIEHPFQIGFAISKLQFKKTDSQPIHESAQDSTLKTPQNSSKSWLCGQYRTYLATRLYKYPDSEAIMATLNCAKFELRSATQFITGNWRWSGKSEMRIAIATEIASRWNADCKLLAQQIVYNFDLRLISAIGGCRADQTSLTATSLNIR